MNTVTLDGVEYKKATEVAKQFGYTSDYLGQLCRAKKINARLVGRSWFVNVPSLEKHRSNKYQTIGKSTKKHTNEKEKEAVSNSNITSKQYLKRVLSPEPRIKKIQNQALSQSGGILGSARYEPDDGALLPKVKSSPKVTLLKVSVAESEQLPITSTAPSGETLVPGPIPDVALSGSVNVSAIPEDDEPAGQKKSTAKKEATQMTTSFKRDKFINKVKINKSDTTKSSSKAAEINSDSSKTVVVSIKKPQKKSENRLSKNTSRQNNSLDIKIIDDLDTPEASKAQEITVMNTDSTVKNIQIEFKLPALATVAGVVVGVLLLSTEQVLIVSDQVLDSEISLAWKNVKNLATVLFTG